MLYATVITVLTCYLLGNLNGAICASALLHDDVRNHGSGNAGLTNFIRNYGASRSLMVIAIDTGKAALACLSAGLIFEPMGLGTEGMVLGGLSVLLGHTFPALLGFRGGKGILSGLIVALVIDWRVAVIILAVFSLAYGLSGYVSLGSVLAGAAFGICFAWLHHDNLPVVIGTTLISLLVLFMHRGNISRLLHGQEQKTNLFGKGKQS